MTWSHHSRASTPFDAVAVTPGTGWVLIVLAFGLVYDVSDWVLLVAGPILSFLHHCAAAPMVHTTGSSTGIEPQIVR